MELYGYYVDNGTFLKLVPTIGLVVNCKLIMVLVIKLSAKYTIQFTNIIDDHHHGKLHRYY